MPKDPQSRKWLLTINNPLEKGFIHEKIKEELAKMKSIVYWCMSDEIGLNEKTHHTHIYLVASSGIRFSTIKNRFPSSHIDKALGTSAQNRDYVFKLGKWEDDPKEDTKIPDTQEEWGELPFEHPGIKTKFADLYNKIKDGKTTAQIIEEDPDFLPLIEKIDKVRQAHLEEVFSDISRDIETIYVFGKTGTGKTRSIMEEHGYSNVFRVTNYRHGCFDGYKGQDVIVFEEFNSSLKIQEMLTYLDIYPVELPCRFVNKTACFTKIYITSNSDLTEQYLEEFEYKPETWKAFIRRIHKVIEYTGIGEFQEYSTAEYLKLKHDIDVDIF